VLLNTAIDKLRFPNYDDSDDPPTIYEMEKA
jgi:hypothetical protein